MAISGLYKGLVLLALIVPLLSQAGDMKSADLFQCIKAILSWSPSTALGFAKRHQRNLPSGNVDYYEIEGTGGPTLVFIHGAPGNVLAFLPQARDPIPGYRHIFINRPGYGRTSSSRNASIEAQTEILAPFIDQLGDIVFVANSYGVAVAMHAALSNPKRVKGFFGIGAALMSEEAAKAAPLPWPLSKFLFSRNLVEMESGLRAIQSNLPNLRFPVLLMHGTEDGNVPVESLSVTERELKAVHREHLYTQVRVEGGLHFLQLYQPQQLKAELSKFLAVIHVQ